MTTGSNWAGDSIAVIWRRVKRNPTFWRRLVLPQFRSVSLPLHTQYSNMIRPRKFARGKLTGPAWNSQELIIHKIQALGFCFCCDISFYRKDYSFTSRYVLKQTPWRSRLIRMSRHSAHCSSRIPFLRMWVQKRGVQKRSRLQLLLGYKIIPR